MVTASCQVARSPDRAAKSLTTTGPNITSMFGRVVPLKFKIGDRQIS